ncbi:MAG: 16S rRNA (guanine(966)-N(2))-methyltransferase RsmD [Nitrosomonas sp.]|nr:16S rRNA (guanine(966)-N(2))-methyltransferase RsmD [Nitrosomonas sp.]
MTLTQGKVRIIGGQWRRHLITFPDHADLRPTPDRVRETVFNWLGQDLSGIRCLDLFAGSGVLGFEAASRRAKQVVMVESDLKVFRTLLKNKEKLHATHVELVHMNALEFIVSDVRRFDIIFLDPPYRLELLPELLPTLMSRLDHNGQIYIETGKTWTPDSEWQIKRSGRAGKVYYQLLELAHG